MNNDGWWVARIVAVVAAISAPGAWAVMWGFERWMRGPSPNLWVVAGWSVSIALIAVWYDAAKMNERRVDEESRVLRPGHRNGRPQ